jgi:hypothetical protein
MIETVCPSFPQVKMFVKPCFHHNSVNSQPISLTFGVICSCKIDASNGTNSPVHNQLQPVFYRLLFISATATATDPDPGQPDLKFSLLWSIFAVQSSPVQLPVHMTGLSNTMCNYTALSIPIRLADSTVVYSDGVGDMVFHLIVNGHSSHAIQFTCVLHVPNLHSNLLSYLYLTCNKGYQILITSEQLQFRYDGKLVMTATINTNNAALG